MKIIILFFAIFQIIVLLPILSAAQTPFEPLERVPVKSHVLGEERAVLVRLPDRYAARTDERFPVLYITDPDVNIQNTSCTVSYLESLRRMPEMIVVGIVNKDRTRDLTPTRVESRPGYPNSSFPTSGGADKFLKFIETELIPLVESKYRTQPYRSLAGHSFGGLFAVHAMLSKPELFNSFIAVSPSLWWDNFLLIERAKEFFKTRKEYDRTFFTSLGNETGGISDAFRLFRDELQRQQMKGFVWESVRYEDEDHLSVALRSHYAGLRKIYDGWMLPRDPETNAISGGLKGIEDHYRKLSERFKYTIVAPRALMNSLGYTLMRQGNMEESIAAFKLNVERYPNSANVYDSLAEAYERDGKLDLALLNYEQAYTLGVRTNDPNTNLYKKNRDRAAVRVNKTSGAPDAKP